ncbi:MAG: 50S ribosomal protein L21 [Candidatus Paceibacterota bacterium]
MTFAIIETGGKQYKVAEGETLKVEKLPAPEKGQTITFDKVLLIDDGKETKIGDPYLAGVTVTADWLQTGRSKKVTVLKFKNKIRYKKVYGHRQPFTEVKIAGLKTKTAKN